jgi:hypothetical protein
MSALPPTKIKPFKVKVKPAESKWFLDRPIEDYAWTPDGFYTSLDGHVQLLPNNKQFGNWINQEYAQYKIKTEQPNTCATSNATNSHPSDTPIFSHQAFVVDYMSPNRPNRGLLINHELGSGKTRTGIETSSLYIKLGIKPILLTPATLKPTWIKEIKLWGLPQFQYPKNFSTLNDSEQTAIDAQLDALIFKAYDFVSYNASNTLEQLRRCMTSDKVNHRLVIVDEVHNFISLMMNPKGKLGPELYRMMMESVDTKFLFFTATPILNVSFEAGLMFNILKGYMSLNGTQYTLFPELRDDFDKYFIDTESNKIRNPELFKKRILGLVSYYYGAKGDVYPDLVLLPPIEIPFSDYQYEKYQEIRNDELKKERQKAVQNQKKRKRDSSKATEDVNSTFRVYSRQYSNYVLPERIKRPMPKSYENVIELKLSSKASQWTPEQITAIRELITALADPDGDPDDLTYEQFTADYTKFTTEAERREYLHDLIETSGLEHAEFPGLTSDEDQFIMDNIKTPQSYQHAIEQVYQLLDLRPEEYFAEDLSDYGPKFEALYRKLNEGEGRTGPAFVYSQFLNLGGLQMLSRVLDAHGFTALPYDNISMDNIYSFADGTQRYVIYSGSEDNATRNRILKIFNHPANQHGEICKVFMGTAASAEGLSLKNTTQVHIVEPFWNEVRIRQVVGRARRVCSHSSLPRDERKVFVYRYHMVYSPKQLKLQSEKLTTDQFIYELAKRKEAINNQFLRVIRDAAVDCGLNAFYNITKDNPIECFRFDERETGMAYYPAIAQDKLDVQTIIHYKTKEVNYATFNTYPKDDVRFYDPHKARYFLVYKYQSDPKIPLKERIKTLTAKPQEFTATVLYDLDLAKSGNQFHPVKAIIDTQGKTVVISSKQFEVIS